MKTVIIIPVKSTSSRIKSKNYSNFGGMPLFIYTIKKLQNNDFIDEIWIDSDDENIMDIVADYNYECKFMHRDSKYANNQTDGNVLFMNEVKNIEADIYIQLLCTSPFTQLITIKKTIDILIENKYDSVVAGFRDKLYLWNNNKPEYNINKIPNSNDLPDTFIESMSLYAMKKQTALNINRRIGDNPYFLEISRIESIDINYPEDMEYAKLVLDSINNKENLYFNKIKYLLTSEILIDNLSLFNMKHQYLPYLKLNIPSKKILGRARLIDLKYLDENENKNDIYNALESYNYCEDGNVIFVNNPCENSAYFGGLNGLISKSKGVNGVVINGLTRDLKENIEIDLPVIYKDLCASDIKGVGTVKSISKKININERLTIYQDDLIYGDVNGVIIIPKKIEKELLNKSIKTSLNENSIKNKLYNGYNINDIINENGLF
jgi:CMP-N-acetylneuraminic acid synthetase/regulator of RNase E activity RraA